LRFFLCIGGNPIKGAEICYIFHYSGYCKLLEDFPQNEKNENEFLT